MERYLYFWQCLYLNYLMCGHSILNMHDFKQGCFKMKSNHDYDLNVWRKILSTSQIFRIDYSTSRSNRAEYIDFHDEWNSYHLKIYHGISLVDPLFIWLSIYETFMYAFEIVIVRNGFFMYTESMRLIKAFMDSV